MKRKEIATKRHKMAQRELRKNLRLSVFICGFISFCVIIFSAEFISNSPQKVSASDSPDIIEDALYTRQEFFGAEAIVSVPTTQARENLLKIAEREPNNLQVLEKLAEVNEKLSDFGEAEKILIRLAEIDAAKLENLAAFYNRRARYEKEAETLRKILLTAGAEKRASVFGRLINLAKRHDLKEYLRGDFYAQIAKENPNVYAIFEKLINDFTQEKNYAEALRFTRQAKTQFPEKRSVLLEKEINILLKSDNAKEAEKVYQAAFDPFWSEEEAEKFYQFLSDRDRLRAYGAELKNRFKRNPADFDAAIRLVQYRNHDYIYDNDEITPIILRLEQAKKQWTTEELVIVTRLLLKANEGELASRFLYTLYIREDFKTNSELRSKILYQLFEMFSDAENQRLPLTKGDLRFYEDVAKTDTSPGIATGILSLIFSDTNPGARLREQESRATKYFNRAAAYRIFQAYKEEFPTSPELAQMYLDIVRLYTATKETEIAEKTLDEFAERYENASDFPAVALKLADAFAAVGKPEKEREVYQKILDFLGKQDKSLAPKPVEFSTSGDSRIETFPDPNEGINIPNQKEKPKSDYFYFDRPKSQFRDYLAREPAAVTYAEVLEKLVSSLAKEKKTVEILAFYSNEIQKYPDEEWLYERRLAWLEQTNLAEDQLKAYQTALARFESRSWRDKLARWFLRQKRQAEFAEFSRDLVAKLSDQETQNYLSQFASENISASNFEKQLFLALYQTALRRFPHNHSFVTGLLRFYKANKLENEWRKLAAEYYFESKEVRELFLDDLAKKNELRAFLVEANGESAIYELFRADAAARLSNFENSVAAYRKLNQLYPNTPEFSERLINFTRSFGQKNREFLAEAANLAQSQTDFLPSSAEYRTRSGEIYAELGLYEKARESWEELIANGKGEKETYLDAATVYWDYFQYDDVLQTIKTLREKFKDDSLYAFEAGAILEAQQKQDEAIGEYVRALAARDNETPKEKSKRRLANLLAREIGDKKSALKNTIEAAFLKESARQPDAALLALGYAEFLAKIKQIEKADGVLKRAMSQSRDNNFLESVRDFYQSADDKTGEQAVLKRLVETAENPRQEIAYRLQLAESYEENRNRDSARAVLSELVRKFPTNYGVITEAADFYFRLGFENESVVLLQNALSRSKGHYGNRIAQKLAARLIRLERLAQARQILSRLYDEDKTDTEIFGELAKIYVRLNDAENLRKIFGETLVALKQTDTDRRELNDEIAGLRRQMIDAFTRLEDYKSAIEQHIEIINREPDDEQLTEDAIRYVQRYGGAETLLSYYQKVSAESFKNYRWNVVLARIYEAKNDWENAAENYRAAIINQPEMIELYLALAEAETRRNNFDEALKNLDLVLEFTGDAPEYVKKKIEILKKAGRMKEIEAEKAKLPAEEKPRIVSNEFAKAQKLGADEKEKARGLYREAFKKLLENPLASEMKTADISAYVHSIREEESLGEIAQRLWLLREKLIEKADEAGSTEAGEARRRLSILEGALTESVGNIAKTIGTDEERASLHEDLRRRIEKISINKDRHQTLSLIVDLSRRAGFGDLEEMVLQKKLDETNLLTERQINLQNLLNFYNERGAYQKVFEALEKYESSNLQLKAETARLVNNREKELEALRAIYWRPDKINVSSDANVARYLEILYSENRAELKSLAEKSSAYQLQLINFLLGKGEAELVHAAIENAQLSPAWKVSRHAETSLALREFGEAAECYFCEALQIDSIENFIEQKPDKKRFLINDDWFRLSRQYGEWLFESKDSKIPPAQFLTAMIENQPRNAAEQVKLGEFYFGKNDLKSAIEHFRLALELQPEDKAVWAQLGAAYFLAGKKDWAEESWEKALGEKDVQSGLSFLRTLQKYNLAQTALEKLPPIIVEFLKNNDADQSAGFQNLIRAVAAPFTIEAEKSAYFLQILKMRPTDTSLAEMLINESLIAKDRQNEFYELLIRRSRALSGYDYDYSFTSLSQRVLDKQDAESIFDQENDFRTEEPDSSRYKRQKKYLGLLIESRENAKAEKLIAEIEKDLSGRYARPAWLRLAKIKMQIRAGKFDLPEVERFIGITVSDSATEIKLPSIERFNDIARILKEENFPSELRQISESFFARMLALGQFEAANFIGLSHILFEKGDAEKALRVLQLMIDARDESKREIALGEIAAIDIVKAKSADAAKISETVNSIDYLNALQFAAEIAVEFQKTEAAIHFRRQIIGANPNDSANKIELAKLLTRKGEKNEAANLLRHVIDDRNSMRSARWQARMVLTGIGENAGIFDAKFDAFSQFYRGVLAEKNGQTESAIEFFLNSLIAEKDAEIPARQQLIKLYALTEKPFAALKLAETDNSAKSDELLQMLSEAAEKTGDFARAIGFERSKSKIDEKRVTFLQQRLDEKNRRATDFTIDLENTRKL